MRVRSLPSQAHELVRKNVGAERVGRLGVRSCERWGGTWLVMTEAASFASCDLTELQRKRLLRKTCLTVWDVFSSSLGVAVGVPLRVRVPLGCAVSELCVM